MRLGILRSASLLHANAAGAVMFGGYVSFQFIVTLYVQNSLGWSPITMSLAFLPAGLIVVASATRMDRVLDRVSTPVLITAGLLAFLGGYLLFLRVGPGMSYADFLLPTMLLIGVGFALTFPAVNTQATDGVADHEQGLAAGLVNTSMQIGGAAVLAAITAVLGKGSSTTTGGQLLPHMTTAIAVVAGVTIVGVVGTLARLVRLRVARPRVAPETACVAC